MAVRLPLVVVVFMASVALIVSWQVLSRLDEAQARRLRDVAAAHLDGLASAVTDPVIREDVWEIYDALDRARQDHAGLKPTDTVVAAPDGRVLAASDPRSFPSWSPLPSAFLTQAAGSSDLAIRPDAPQALARRDLSSGSRGIGAIYATFDVGPLLAERQSVKRALIATNVVLTLVLAAMAWLTVRHMMAPLRILSRHLQGSEAQAVAPVPPEITHRATAEARKLYGAFNRMAEAVQEREILARQLAEEERLASLGRLASGMAHEINNPLGGLFNAIDTLKAHGDRPDVRRRSLDLVERGLKGIRDVVRATLVTHRGERPTRDLEAADLDDLRLLVGPEIRRRNLVLTWDNALEGTVAVPATAVRQVVLNLLLNACQATPANGEVTFTARSIEATIVLTVEDTGSGMDETGHGILGGTSRAGGEIGTGGGLGLWMVRRLVVDMGGGIASRGRPPRGTVVRVSIPLRAGEGLADVA
jgi:signal transduction histidine kinase